MTIQIRCIYNGCINHFFLRRLLTFTRPELKIILYCAKVEIDRSKIDLLKDLLQQKIDWEYLLLIARLHKVTPLIYVNLMKICPEAVPQDILNKLKQFIAAKTRRNLHLLRELNELTAIFQKNNIPAIPYKGLILAAEVYGDLSLRQFVDLDFLVARQNYSKAQELLIDRGYGVPSQKDVDWEKTFIHPQKQIAVDLHQGLTPPELPFYVDFPNLWQRLKPVSIGGVEVKSFSAEDLLIILCVQLAKDSQWTAEVLIKVCDIAELLRAYQNIDWNLVWQRCTKLGTKRILLFSLYIANSLLETKLPESIWQKIQQDDIAKKAATQVCEELLLRSEKTFVERIFKERVFLRHLAKERWQDKFTYFITTTLIPNEEEFSLVSLPKPFFFLYYFVRPVRLSFKVLASIGSRKNS